MPFPLILLALDFEECVSMHKGECMMPVSDWNNCRKLHELNFSNAVLPLKGICSSYNRSGCIASMDRDTFRANLTVIYDFLHRQSFIMYQERAFVLTFTQKRLKLLSPSLSSRKISRTVSWLFSLVILSFALRHKKIYVFVFQDLRDLSCP